MECLLALGLVIGLVMAIAAVAGRGSGRSRRRKSYQAIAKRFRGVYVSGNLFRRPSVLIRYGDTRAVLRECRARGPYEGICTQIQLDWPDAKTQCELFPASLSNHNSTFRRWSLLRTGDAPFDAQVRTYCPGPTEVASLLSDGVRWQIDRLHTCSHVKHFYLIVRRQQIIIQKPVLLRKNDDLETYVQLALELYDQMMLTRAVGIEFVAPADAQMLEEVTCKICGDTIITDMVFCRRCKTPHHGDCWQYNGACSIYGCQETTYQRPQTGVTSRASELDGSDM